MFNYNQKTNCNYEKKTGVFCNGKCAVWPITVAENTAVYPGLFFNGV
jgi:hypothetical protein